jgi:MATE family multidrug resistance protein
MASEPPLPHSVPLPLTRRAVFAQAWPIMLGQATIPLVGIVDATVIGRTGDSVALAAVALGATIMNFLFWAFGFLRMSMTGLTAQSDGAGDAVETRTLLQRGLLLGLAIGAVMVALQWLLIPISLGLFAGGGTLDETAGDYLAMAFIGGPAALGIFAINGWLLGLGRTREALLVQLVMNVVNIGLDLLFVWRFGMGAAGVGLGTALAQWSALAVGLLIAARIAGRKLFRVGHTLLDRLALRRMFAINADIMIRTVALLLLFAWFANAGARLGTGTLAANHVLMQFVSVAAFVLDGFAFTAEARVGQAIGARSRDRFLHAVRLTSEFCLAAGAALALVYFLAGESAIAFVTTDPAVRAEAARFLPFAALVPLIGMPSWMLDGVFIGATGGKALRNAALTSTSLYLATDLALRPYGNLGVWIAFCCSYAFRAGALALWYPGLLRTLAADANRP